MNDSNQARFIGNISETYDRVLGPFLFEHYARNLAARIEAPAGGRILEIACGTGISTEQARSALDASISISRDGFKPADAGTCTSKTRSSGGY